MTYSHADDVLAVALNDSHCPDHVSLQPSHCVKRPKTFGSMEKYIHVQSDEDELADDLIQDKMDLGNRKKHNGAAPLQVMQGEHFIFDGRAPHKAATTECS